MDWQEIQDGWGKYVAAAKSRWNKLSEEQLAATRGRREVLCARVQEAYGLTRQQSDFQVSEWQSTQTSR